MLAVMSIRGLPNRRNAGKIYETGRYAQDHKWVGIRKYSGKRGAILRLCADLGLNLARCFPAQRLRPRRRYLHSAERLSKIREGSFTPSKSNGFRCCFRRSRVPSFSH
jgi:hypothetical protein